MNGFQGFGKTLVDLGAIVVLIGVVFMLSEKIHFPFLGKLPGDIHIKGRNFQFYFPIATSIVLSVLLTLILWAISFFSRK